MRTAGLIALTSVALVAPAWSQDVYRWQDGTGQVHYSNTPPAEGNVTRLGEAPLPYAATPPDAPAEAAASETAVDDAGDDDLGAGEEVAARPAPAPGGDDAAVSTAASLRRSELERDLRATEKRRREVDAKLKSLAAQRTRFGAGSESLGGVRTSALDLRSEEEKALEEEREQLSRHAVEVRSEGAKLRDEVSRKLGSVPDWWIDLR